MAEIVIQPIVEKIMDYLADALKKQLSYLCRYSSNVQNLAHEVEQLIIRYESVQDDVDAARANFGVIRPEVEAWLKKVEELIIRSDKIRDDAEEIQRSSMCKWFPLLHYSLSKKAFKTTQDSMELRNTKFDKIFNHVIPAEIALVPTHSNVGFESRNLIEDKIVDALKDPSVYSIGIWGIGGVGKTVMVQKIEKKVRDEKSLFQHVVMVIVSQKPDLRKLQSQIAEALNLRLSEESLVLRQRELHQRLKAEKSILIILDDLWECLELGKLGIPSQTTHAHCKLILTSRDMNVLTSTGVPFQNLFQLGILTREESWRFFKDNAGIINLDDDDSHNELVQIARKIERECKGLPLALKIVSSALEGQDISFWYNAVQELKSIPKNIPGVLIGVYQPLKYSFNALESEEQKVLFLLCCLFPEDYSISIEELLRCGIGLRIFKGLNNLIVVRNKVKTVLNILLSRSLLIKGDKYSENFEVRMHDVVRDVGIWIATEEGMVGSNGEKHLLMISHGLNECPLMTEEDSSNINNCTFISFLFSHPSITFPKSIVYPKLEFLRLDVVHNVELPESFFNGMGELKVLEALINGLLPPSIGELNSLRTLFLQGCKIFQKISMLGNLINLEILSLRNCECEMLPIEIRGLKKLKQLKILNCISLRRIAFGVISGLTRLEELVIVGCFNNWEAKDGGEKGVACLSELNGLENLTTLKIEIGDPNVVPIEKPLWIQKVKIYGISISHYISGYMSDRHQKGILLGKEVANPLGDWVYDIASNAEYLSLEGSNCMNVLKWLSQNSRNLSYLKELRLSIFTGVLYLVEGLQKGAIFPKLEHLEIHHSDSLKHISNVSSPIGSFVALQDINLQWLSGLICLWKVSVKEQFYFKNFQSINITGCDNLSYLFSLCVAQSLVQLSYLDVQYCDTMKEIFKKHDGELVEKIELPKLRRLYFLNLKSLYQFCNEIDRVELPQLVELTLYKLLNMKMTKGDNIEVHQRYLFPQVAVMNFNFCGLTKLTVGGFENFKCMFSTSIISGVLNLRFLEVRYCSMLEQVIGKGDENVGKDDETILFKNLKELYLICLPNILTFCCKAIQLPSLELLNIQECPKMFKFVEEHPNHISNSTPFLNEQVYCPGLWLLKLVKLNISAAFSPFTFISLTNLKSLKVYKCAELEHIIIKEEGETASEEFTQRIVPCYYNTDITDCPMLEKFSLGSVHLPKLKIISSPKIHSEKNYFIISIKDIFFSSDPPKDITLRFIPIGSSQSFASVAFFLMSKKIVGKFKTEKIQTGIEYEIMLMIMLDEYAREWGDPVQIELKIPGESKLQQRTEILENQPKDTWTEISIGKFIMREPQQTNEELEFSLRNLGRRLWVKCVRIVEV